MNQNIIDKVQPSCTDIEEIVLGQILIDEECFSKISSKLESKMFYNESNKVIYEAIEELSKSEYPINIMTVCDKLKKTEKIEIAGGVYTVSQLTEKVNTSLHVEYHSHLIIQSYLKRQMITAGYDLQNIGYDQTKDLEDSKIYLDKFKAEFDYTISTSSNDYYRDTIISIDEVIEQTNFFLILRNNVNGTNCEFNLFSENSGSIIFGGTGSRKSTFISLLAAVIANGEDIGYFKANEKKVKIIDTEQSPYYAQKILHRASEICGGFGIENITLHSIKKYNYKIKKTIVEHAIIKDKPDIVFIDNIRDFVRDINDFKESGNICEWLKYLQDRYKVHTCVIIHRNKSDDFARGHLGTEIMNMCECQIQIEKNKENNMQSIIKFIKLRDNFNPPDEILEVDENNIPSILRGMSNNDFNLIGTKTNDRPF